MSPDDQAQVRADLQGWMIGAVAAFQADTPRTKQTRIGPSELGGCRRLLQGKITGEVGPEKEGVKWGAFMGTAAGDWVEKAVAAHGDAQTQVPITCTLASGIKVTGSADIIRGNMVIDLKSKDGIEEIQRTGPSRKEIIQISAYTVGAVQGGVLQADGAEGTLLYFDRSGKDTNIFTYTVTYREALGWLEVADQRIEEITDYMARGQTAPRDEPEPSCFYLKCPLYDACWAGTQPSNEITDPEIVAAIKLYDDARAMKKTAERLIGNAKTTLGAWEEEPVTGATEEFSLNWILRGGAQGTVNRQIDLRRKR